MLNSGTQPWIPAKSKSPRRLGAAVWVGVCLVWLAGCASPRAANSSAVILAEQLGWLSPSVAPAEAKLASETAHSYSLQLAREYHVVRPALLHNTLVNLGIRQRGLCFQWADDLTARLESLDLHTLQIHRGVARLETRREHSSVVLTAQGQAFERGIVLDAWRHSGRLYWGPVAEDKYPWIEAERLPDNETRARAGGEDVR